MRSKVAGDKPLPRSGTPSTVTWIGAPARTLSGNCRRRSACGPATSAWWWRRCAAWPAWRIAGRVDGGSDTVSPSRPSRLTQPGAPARRLIVCARRWRSGCGGMAKRCRAAVSRRAALPGPSLRRLALASAKCASRKSGQAEQRAANAALALVGSAAAMATAAMYAVSGLFGAKRDARSSHLTPKSGCASASAATPRSKLWLTKLWGIETWTIALSHPVEWVGQLAVVIPAYAMLFQQDRSKSFRSHTNEISLWTYTIIYVFETLFGPAKRSSCCGCERLPVQTRGMDEQSDWSDLSRRF